MRTIDPAVTLADIEDATARLPIGARVRTRSSPSLGTVAWRPFACDAGTVSVLVRWDHLHPDRNTHYVRTRDLLVAE